MSSRLALALALAFLVALVANAAEVIPVARHKATTPSMRHLARSLAEVGKSKRSDRYSNSTSLDKVFSGVTLFKYKQDDTTTDGDETTKASGSVEVKCSTCYTKGKATASITVDGSFDPSTIKDAVSDAASDTLDQLEDYVDSISLNLDPLELDVPPLDINLDITIPDFPEAVIELQFDGVELYVELDTTFSGGVTYTLNLWKSKGMDIDIGTGFFLGLLFSLDLILSSESKLTIQSGFHIKLDDGVLLKMALFAEEASDMTLNGGKFEFLPVTVESAGTVLKAVLQLSAHAGFTFKSVDLTDGYEIDLFDINSEDFKASAGIEGRLYANVAQFVTNITASTDDDADCALKAVQEYQFVVGAAAGATVGIGAEVWGPTATSEVPVYTTTIAEVCAQTPTTSPAAVRRVPQDGSESTTLEREQTYTAVLCESTGIIDCPASLQTLVENTITETLVTNVGASWPEATTDVAALTTVGFGDNVKDMIQVSGKPKTYTGDGAGNDYVAFFDRKTGGVSNAVIVGVSVGVGVPVLIAILVGTICCCRRCGRPQRLSPASSTGPMQPVYSPASVDTYGNYGNGKHASYSSQPIQGRY